MIAFVRNTALLALILALGTVFAGWWSVPLLAAIWTLALPSRGSAISAGVAGGLAWAGLLLLSARNAPVTNLANVLGQIMSVSGASLLTMTVAYAALLAGAAALVASTVVSRSSRRAFHTRDPRA